MSDWDEFLAWAKRFTDEVDLVAEERNYKVAAAEHWRVALDACRSGASDWPALLRRAAGAGNLVDQFSQTWLRNAIDAHPEEVRTAFVALVDASTPDAIGAFQESLKSWGDYVSPGDITTFVSLVHMGSDPTQPPYRAQFVTDWGSSVGHPAGGSPKERYAALLALCDELIEQSAGTGVHVRDRLDAQGLAWTVLKYEPPVRWSPLTQAEMAAWRSGQPSGEVSVARGTGWSLSMENAAWVVLGRGLRGETSAIAPQVTTWHPTVAGELKHRIEDNPNFGAGSFMEKLKGQLADASDEVKVLAAELIYIHSAPLVNVSPKRKRQRLTAILGWSQGHYKLPPELDAGLDADGAFNGGVGFNVQMWNQLTWLCRFVITWSAQDNDRRERALRDPFEFNAVTAEVPKEVRSIRHSLEYLAWPGVFPAVASSDHRRLILKGMAGDIGGPSGTDNTARTRDLVSLRQWHERKARSGPVEWYKPPYVERWFPDAQRAPRAWLIRPGDGGSALIDDWLSEGFVSLSAKLLGTVPPGSSEAVVSQAVKEGYLHLDASQREATTAAYHAFLTLMNTDDVIATIDSGRLYVGMVSDDATYVEVPGSRLRREVSWTREPISQGDLAAPVPSLLDQQGTVVDATAAYDILADLINTTATDDEEDTDPVPTIDRARPATTPTLPAVTEAVAASLHMNRSDLQEIVDLLQRRQQIVLYGPPGTGKTYVAKELAKHLVGDPSRVRLVQFRPSYAYEDFFEGYRPVSQDGQATFALKDGPLRLLAAEAKNPENRENAYILIVDEMNRANLAKVFGELYFLLEYRQETVRLQYRPDEAFFLPPNLFIVGTMNTADRSIALVDAAIRRRFPFYEMHPSEEPVKSVLGRYLAANHITDDRAELLAELNHRMGEGGRDLQIGPSYLMRGEVRSDADIDLVWKYDLLPLLDEHFYGEQDRQAIRSTFGLGALRKAIAKEKTVSAAGMDNSEVVADSEKTDETIDLTTRLMREGDDDSA